MEKKSFQQKKTHEIQESYNTFDNPSQNMKRNPWFVGKGGVL